MVALTCEAPVGRTTANAADWIAPLKMVADAAYLVHQPYLSQAAPLTLDHIATFTITVE